MTGLTKDDIGFVDSWNIRDKDDVHPSHRTPVVEVSRLREVLEEFKSGQIEHDGSYVAWSDVKKKIDDLFGVLMEEKKGGGDKQ